MNNDHKSKPALAVKDAYVQWAAKAIITAIEPTEFYNVFIVDFKARTWKRMTEC